MERNELRASIAARLLVALSGVRRPRRRRAERTAGGEFFDHAELSGTATRSRISLSGITLCSNWDPFRVSVELTR